MRFRIRFVPFGIRLDLFTGLYDKNNKKIYENDELVYRNNYEESCGGQRENSVGFVHFLNGCFYFGGLPLFEYIEEEDVTILEIIKN